MKTRFSELPGKGLIALLMSLNLAGCMYTRTLTPESADVPAPEISLPSVKVSYSISDLRDSSSPAVDRDKVISAALLSTLEEWGIRDVIRSDRYEPDRINISIYQLENRTTWAGRHFAFPWAIIAGATMFILPAAMTEIHPIELHIVDPQPGMSPKFTVARSNWIQKDWMWTGFAVYAGSADENHVLLGHNEFFGGMPRTGPDAWQKLELAALRKTMRPILRKALLEHSKA